MGEACGCLCIHVNVCSRSPKTNTHHEVRHQPRRTRLTDRNADHKSSRNETSYSGLSLEDNCGLIWSITIHPSSNLCWGTSSQHHHAVSTHFKALATWCLAASSFDESTVARQLMQTFYWKPKIKCTLLENSSKTIACVFHFLMKIALFICMLTVTCISFGASVCQVVKVWISKSWWKFKVVCVCMIRRLFGAYECVWFTLSCKTCISGCGVCVCVWSWCTAPMWLRVFTSDGGREGKWAMTQEQRYRSRGCRHYPEQEKGQNEWIKRD